MKRKLGAPYTTHIHKFLSQGETNEMYLKIVYKVAK